MKYVTLVALILSLLLTACTDLDALSTKVEADEVGRVVRVVDGDTIEVEIDGEIYDVRYIGVNTPESDEPCYREATNANDNLVFGKTISLVRDVSDTDRFGRLLRYIYVGDTLINRELVVGGYAEAVIYEPDNRFYEAFVRLEAEAAQGNLGCHPTGIFNDGSTRR